MPYSLCPSSSLASFSNDLILGDTNVCIDDCHIKPFRVRNLASIIAESKLIEVSLHVLAPYVIIDSIDNTFAEIAPKAFYGVGIGIAINILVFSVVNHFAIVYLSYQSIATPFIGKESCGTLY